MQDIPEEQRPKFFLACIVVLLLAYVAGNWAATQYIADHYAYSEHLSGALFGSKLYHPFALKMWQENAEMMTYLGPTVRKYFWIPWLFYAAGVFLCFQIHQVMKRMTSHGTAGWAKKKDIAKAGLCAKSGFVVGRNPFTKKMLLHDGPEHVLLVAPTRSGKGVCNMVPTGLCWRHSIFLFDPKGELWNFTASWRQKHFGQKVMKFEPLSKDGSSAKWNPFAEIDFQSFEELTDTSTVSEMMVKTGGESKDPFWENSAVALVNGVILHLLYKHHQENRLLPCPSDVMTLLSSPTMSTAQLFATMKMYPHISKEEFLEIEGKTNILKKIYGEYIENFEPFRSYAQKHGDNLMLLQERFKENEAQGAKYAEALKEGRDDAPAPKSNLEILQETLRYIECEAPMNERRSFDFSCPDLAGATEKKQIEERIAKHIEERGPWFLLLVHPKVAEAAANIYNGAKETSASILQTAQTAMAVYQDPLIRKNTAVSDFTLRDLLDPRQEVSLYLVLQPNDIDKLRPILRLFVNTMLSKLVRDMEFEEQQKGSQGKAKKKDAQPKKQRLLLMLDEFPQLGKLDAIEKSLVICAGYGVKICIVAQSMGQLNKIYTKDNAIPGNCHVQIYFTPTLEDGGGTAKTLSETLGEKTIHSFSRSTTGEAFKGSTSTSNMARKLMTPDEVRRMDAEKELVFVAGFRPIFGDKIRYYKEKFFTDKITAPPLISDTATEIKSYAHLFRVHAAERRKIEDRQIAVAKARQQMEKTARKETAPDEAKHLQEGDAATENPKVVLDKTPSQRGQAASPAKGAQAVERARDEQAKKEGQAEPAVQTEEAEPQDLQSILYAEVEKILREEQEEEKKQQEKLQESA